jgi:hypothetical protein
MPLRRHAQGAVQTYYFAVYHLVLYDVPNESSVFGGLPEAGRKRYCSVLDLHLQSYGHLLSQQTVPEEDHRRSRQAQQQE